MASYAGAFFRATLNTNLATIPKDSDIALSHNADPIGLSANSRARVYAACRFSRHANDTRVGTYQLSADTDGRALIADTEYAGRFVHLSCH